MKKKFGFSLAETIVIITAFAIAVASITPIITRNIINNTDTGATLGGGAHGRYEAFVKELLTFEDPNADPLIAYEKYATETCEDMTGKICPVVRIYKKINNNVYEELNGLTPEKNNKGEIIYPITKATDASGKIFVKSNKYVFETGKVYYKEVEYIPEKKDSGKVVYKLNKEISLLEKKTPKQRIIESRLTQLKSEKSSAGNNLWEVKKDNGKVISQPWERIYSESKLVKDAPLEDYVTKFQAPSNAKNVTIYAVGAGGNGGKVDNSDSNKNTFEADDDLEITKNIKEGLSKTIDEHIADLESAKNKVDEADLPFIESELIDWKKIKSDKTLLDKIKFEKGKNGSAGTIKVPLNVEIGGSFPYDYMFITKTLGTATQEPENVLLKDIDDKWFDWSHIEKGGFLLTAAVKGGAGGKGGDILQNIAEDVNLNCFKKAFIKTKDNGCSNYFAYDQCHTGENWTYRTQSEISGSKGKYVKNSSSPAYFCGNTKVDEKNWTCGDGSTAVEKYYSYEKNSIPGNQYCQKYSCSLTDSSNYYTCTAGIPSTQSEQTCNGKVTSFYGTSFDICHIIIESSCTRKNIIPQKYKGGSGGSAPPCAYRSAIVTKPTSIFAQCQGSGGSGHSAEYTVDRVALAQIPATTGNGKRGTTCIAQTGEITKNGLSNAGSSLSVGGGGGKGCMQNQYNYTSMTISNLSEINNGSPLINAETGELIIQYLEPVLDENGNQVIENGQVKNEVKEAIIGTVLDGKTISNSETTYYQTSWEEMIETITTADLEINWDGVKQLEEAANTRTVQGTALEQEYWDKITNTTNNVKATQTNEYSYSPWSPNQGSQTYLSLGLKEETDSNQTGLINITSSWTCKALTEYSCHGNEGHLNGVKGYAKPEKAACENMPKGTKAVDETGDIKIFNEEYTWETPFATKHLIYGEGGAAGEFGEVTVEDLNNKVIKITLGKANSSGKKGDDTKVEETKAGFTIKNFITAKGGTHGMSNLKSSKYPLCFPNSNGNCIGITENKTTREIKATASKTSSFENIKTLVGNSSIVGIGLGRSAEGMGSVSNGDMISGTRKAYVSSEGTKSVEGYSTESSRTILNNPSGDKTTSNTIYTPPVMDFKPGDGAVIIKW